MKHRRLRLQDAASHLVSEHRGSFIHTGSKTTEDPDHKCGSARLLCSVTRKRFRKLPITLRKGIIAPIYKRRTTIRSVGWQSSSICCLRYATLLSPIMNQGWKYSRWRIDPPLRPSPYLPSCRVDPIPTAFPPSSESCASFDTPLSPPQRARDPDHHHALRIRSR